MHYRILAAALAATSIAAPAQAQEAEVEGYWMGSLELTPGTVIRVGLGLNRNEAGELEGYLDSPDQNALGIPLDDIAVEDGWLSFTVPAVSGSYRGEWNGAEGAWVGTLSQAGTTWPLTLRPGTPDPAEASAGITLPETWAIPTDADIAGVIDDRIGAREGAGMVVGVIDRDERRIIARGPAGPEEFDSDTVFEIGSMTKVFTALLLADMVLRGEVALDDPVQKYLPEGATMPTRGGEQITLRHLAMHSSGLPRLPGNMPYSDPQDPYADYTEEMLLEFVSEHRLTRDIGSQYEYSNLGVGLLGYVLTRAAGTDYETLLRQRILDPLGMDDTGVALTPEQVNRFAQGHDPYMRPAKPWSLAALAGAGALRSTASDMLTFLDAALDPDSPIAPALDLTLSSRIDQVGTDSQSALGWMTGFPPTGEVLMHGGGTGGFRSFMALQPETGNAVVVLTNAAAEPSAEDIALQVLVGAPVADAVPVPLAPPAATEREEVALTPEQLDHVTGTYRLTPGVEIVIEREGGQLTARVTGQPAFPIYPSGPLEFFWKVVNAQVRFTEEDGVVTGGTFIQDGREVPVEIVD